LIDAATSLESLKVPPGSQLEALKGNRKRQHSIRINQHWRVCFRWTGNDAEGVEITDYHEATMTTTITRTHPGIILREEFFEPLGITQLAAARATGIPQSRLSEILSGRRSITADTAVRLGHYFRVDPRNWLNLQSAYDLWKLEQISGKKISREVTPLRHVAA
jgi:addiction module HigA family antidote